MVSETAELEIKGLDAADYGRYECVLSNRVTTLTRETLLIVESELYSTFNKIS